MKSRLAISLSWIAGYTNVIALILCSAVTSHATGNVTLLGLHTIRRIIGAGDGPEGELSLAARFGFVLMCFFAGAVSSAIMTEGARRRGQKSKYILPMAVEALLLCGMALTIEYHEFGRRSTTDTFASGVAFYWIAGLGAFAMGLQNATITRVSGAVVRTTHLTGVVTDFGLEGVQFLLWVKDRLRGRRSRAIRVWRVAQRHPSALRLMLLASIFGSFLFGVVAGTWFFYHWPAYALLLPVVFLLWIIYVDWRKPIADVSELDLLKDPEYAHLADIKASLPPELGLYRLKHRKKNIQHHAPDFQHWAERLPDHWKVIILAVSPMTHFDQDESQNLLAALTSLRGKGRDLIVCGVTRHQYKVLETSGLTEALGLENFCPDLDFAIARGLNRVAELHANHRAVLASWNS